MSRPGTPTLPRLLAGLDPRGGTAGHAAHERAYGSLPPVEPRWLISETERSGLRGRGGADFPTARKLAAVAERRSASAVIVNGAEAEPASAKDRLLMSALPHLVLDGAIAAARAVGAPEVIAVVGPRSSDAATALRAAAQVRPEDIGVSVLEAPAGYVTGEESAIINLLGGGPAKPRFVPPRPYERGYRRAPTLVQNAETLAHLALVARFGGSWFREFGTKEDPGTVLVTVGGAVAAPGVYEIAFGTPVPRLLEAAGGSTEPLEALLLGGYFGTWVTAAEAGSLCLDRTSLLGAGHALGAGVLFALGESACGLCATAALTRYLAEQSAGQCGPCLHGLAALAQATAALATGGARPDDRERLLRWSAEIEGRGACHHPNGAVRLVRSALAAFGGEIDRHARERCRARDAGLPGLRSSRRSHRAPVGLR